MTVTVPRPVNLAAALRSRPCSNGSWRGSAMKSSQPLTACVKPGGEPNALGAPPGPHRSKHAEQLGEEGGSLEWRKRLYRVSGRCRPGDGSRLLPSLRDLRFGAWIVGLARETGAHSGAHDGLSRVAEPNPACLEDRWRPKGRPWVRIPPPPLAEPGLAWLEELSGGLTHFFRRSPGRSETSGDLLTLRRTGARLARACSRRLAPDERRTSRAA
jgi:hypothetical protein